MKIVVLSSSKLNKDKTFFETHKENIKTVLQKFEKDTPIFIIGNVKNRTLIEYIKSLDYDVEEKRQVPGSIGNSNRKMIRECDRVIIFSVENSAIKEFYKYALEHKEKENVFLHEL